MSRLLRLAIVALILILAAGHLDRGYTWTFRLRPDDSDQASVTTGDHGQAAAMRADTGAATAAVAAPAAKQLGARPGGIIRPAARMTWSGAHLNRAGTGTQ
jgi:hypothetical protein